MLSIFLISLVECQLIKHGEGLESLDDKRIDTVSVQSDTHSAHQLAEELSSTQNLSIVKRRNQTVHTAVTQ
ncbi:unnamed protein product [Heterobilharzia americana]|nr:unnamed protein product [Heterobilharzia americana]